MSGARRNRALLALGAIGATLVIAHLIEHGAQPSQPSTPDPAKAAREAIADKEGAVAMLGRSMVAAELKDPSSASFEGVFGRIKDGVHAACGQVNAKNSFGGFTGMSFFVAEVETGKVIVQSPETERAFQRAWKADCTGRSDGTPAPPDGLFGVRWGKALSTAKLKPYDKYRQVWLLKDGQPKTYLGVPITEVQYESDHGRIFGAEVIAKGPDAYDQMKSALSNTYGEPTEENSATGYTAWDWGKGSGLIQLTGSAEDKSADVHLERQVR